MINKEILGVGIAGSGLSSLGSAVSLDQLDRILSISLSVLGLIITIIGAIIIPLVKWYKKAKADGKITKDEINEGVEIIKTGIESVKDAKDKKEK